MVSEAFADAHAVYGDVAENHVIVLEPIADKVAVSPDLLAALLNTAIINQRFSGVSGSFSVSARLLARLALPAVDALPATAEALDGKLGPLLAALNGILVPKTSKARAAEIEEPAEAQAVDLTLGEIAYHFEIAGEPSLIEIPDRRAAADQRRPR